jgi:hypothetical protein
MFVWAVEAVPAVFQADATRRHSVVVVEPLPPLRVIEQRLKGYQ